MMDIMDFNADDLREMYKPWSDTFPGHADQLMAKRFAKGTAIKIDSIHDLNPILSSFFKDKKPTTTCEFVVIPESDHWLVEFTEEVYLDYVEASTNSIPCAVLTQEIEAVELKEPTVFIAQALGFAWRADGEPVVDICDDDDDVEFYKSWSDTFPMHADEFISKRFVKGDPIKVDSIHELNPILSSFFKNKSNTCSCEFVVIPQDGHWLIEFTEENELDFIEATTTSIPCSVLTKGIERLNLKEPMILTAQSLGFAWRTDEQPIMEIFDILEEMQKLD